jgi:hypothetical protein
LFCSPCVPFPLLLGPVFVLHSTYHSVKKKHWSYSFDVWYVSYN